MNQDFPPVSVIIPTHNRSFSLQRTLDALSRQRFPFQRTEVLVVADGCTDPTKEMLKTYPAPFPLRFLEQSRQGPAAARNHGAASATGKYLIFLDDDIETSPQFIEAHGQAHQRWPEHTVIGYLSPDVQVQFGFFHLELQIWWQTIFHEMVQPGHRYTYCDLLTGNFSIEAEIFKRMGGFDASLRCHEDYEFGFRLIRSGIPLILVPEAHGVHHETTTLDRSLKRKYEEGKADVLLGIRHPELRPQLPLIPFLKSPSFRNKCLATLAGRWPGIGDKLADGVRQMLTPLERIKQYRRWQRLFGALSDYWYLRGVMEDLNLLTGPERASLNGSDHKDPADLPIEINLKDGLEAAEQKLNRERPASARLRYGQQPVGVISPRVGAEKLRGAHLRPILATELAESLLKALALETAMSPLNPFSRPPRNDTGLFPRKTHAH